MGLITIPAFISESAAGGAGKRTAEFDQERALLHNSLTRALLERFSRVAKSDPECAMAYWSAATSYNHPF
jgi:hypothetical protein